MQLLIAVSSWAWANKWGLFGSYCAMVIGGLALCLCDCSSTHEEPL